MSFTEFLPRPDLRAHELAHSALMPLPLHLAALLRDELGEPHLRHPRHGASWYGDAVSWSDSQIGMAFVDTTPFALRIDWEGNASVQLPWNKVEAMKVAMFELVPTIRVEQVIAA